MLDLVFKMSSLKAKKGEPGDPPAAGDLQFNHSSLKGETRKRKKPSIRLVLLADTEAISDLQMECCNLAASGAWTGVQSFLAIDERGGNRRYTRGW